METLNEGVVQEEHDGGEPPCPLRVPKKHLTNVTDVLCLRMTQAKLPVNDNISALRMREIGVVQGLPDDKRCVENKCRLDHGQNDAWHETQH